MSKLICETASWEPWQIERNWEIIDKIARKKYGLDYYPAQFEIVSAEQMLDAYSSHAMPNMYKHWSFGKSFISNKKDYDSGATGLALEVVINTDPCIAYLMEDNTLTAQTMVMAHASCGHSSFFKNNFLFKQHTQAGSIVDFLSFAKHFVQECEGLYGTEEVEETLDAAHSLQYYSVDTFKQAGDKRKSELSFRRDEWYKYFTSSDDSAYSVLPNKGMIDTNQEIIMDRVLADNGKTTNSQNLLKFIEKNSLILPHWKKEILRIVRKIAQYFYPQRLTKLGNEGWATFWHYTLMYDMYEAGHLSAGNMIEFLHSHSHVVYQGQQLSQLNVYALGFDMFRRLRKVCENPSALDKECFPHYANTNWVDTLQEVAYNYKDESLVLQILHPETVEKFRLVSFKHDSAEDGEEYMRFVCDEIHDQDGFEAVRRNLSLQYNSRAIFPEVEIKSEGANEYELTLRLGKGEEVQPDAEEVFGNAHELLGGDLRCMVMENNDFIGEITFSTRYK